MGRLPGLKGNEIGNYLKTHREAGGYRQNEVCGGICSVSTFSRIEAGEKAVDFLMVEAFLNRMKIDRSEYEFVLDDEDYDAYMRRVEIEALVAEREYGQAEARMAEYGAEYGMEGLHGQFLALQKGLLEQARPRPDRKRAAGLFAEALAVTAPEYWKKFRQRELLSNLELLCIAEILHSEDAAEEEYEELCAYFAWSRRREGFFPSPYRAVMQYYAERLYQNGKYGQCVRICDEALRELFGMSKVENRGKLFCLRAKARERGGSGTEEENRLCLRDLLTAYHVISFYEGEEQAEGLRQHIGGKYGWQYID